MKALCRYRNKTAWILSVFLEMQEKFHIFYEEYFSQVILYYKHCYNVFKKQNCYTWKRIRSYPNKSTGVPIVHSQPGDWGGHYLLTPCNQLVEFTAAFLKMQLQCHTKLKSLLNQILGLTPKSQVGIQESAFLSSIQVIHVLTEV